jgi:hypothetical protein
MRRLQRFKRIVYMLLQLRYDDETWQEKITGSRPRLPVVSCGHFHGLCLVSTPTSVPSYLSGLLLLDPTAKFSANVVNRAGGIFVLIQAQTLTILAHAGQEAEFLQAQIALL